MQAPSAGANVHSKPLSAEEARKGWYVKDRQERFNAKRSWLVNAWRIVDSNGIDMIQPGCNTKSEATVVAKQLGIKMQGIQPNCLVGSAPI